MLLVNNMSINKIGNKCCGCFACRSVCHFGAIKTTRSFDGFLYPVVDDSLCTNCGLCEKVCPELNAQKKNLPISAYYGRCSDEKVLMTSSSGGAFSLLANIVLKMSGIIFGAVFDAKKKEVVIKNSNDVTLEQLKRSKYVESNPLDSFLQVKEFLENDKFVMYVGLPCEIGGLKKFLNKDYDNLLLVDFLCGGSSSTINFQEHLNFLENRYKSKVIDVNFRPKLYGWKEHSFKVDFENGKSYKTYAYLDTYFRGFVYEKALIRNCCNSCSYSMGHDSDIILADFWGFRQVNGFKDDDKGMSLVMANNDKGIKWIEKIPNNQFKKLEIENIQYAFKPKNDKNIMKTMFLKNYKKYGFEKAAKKTYMKKTKIFKIKKIIKGAIKNVNN